MCIFLCIEYKCCAITAPAAPSLPKAIECHRAHQAAGTLLSALLLGSCVVECEESVSGSCLKVTW